MPFHVHRLLARVRAVTGAVTLLLAVALAPTASASSLRVASAPSPGATVVLRLSFGTASVTESSAGYAVVERDLKSRLVGGYTVSFLTKIVTLFDGTTKRYDQLPLAKALAELRQLRKATFADAAEAPAPQAQLPKAVTHRLSALRLIAGHRAVGSESTLKGVAVRSWFLRPPAKVPADIARALSSLASIGPGIPAGALVVRVEQRFGGSWHQLASAVRITSGAIAPSLLSIPAGLKPGQILEPEVVKQPRSVPATVSRPFSFGYFPVQTHQRAFAIYWGHRFTLEPATVAALNASFGTIEGSPYVSRLGQYDGIGTGSLSGSEVIGSDPPRTLGNADASGIIAATGMVNAALFARGAPGPWLRPDSRQPVYVLFVPANTVTADNNAGYHAGAPVALGAFDPLGLLLLPAVPYIVVKVPTHGVGSDIDAATVTLSHETVETASDPFGIGGWRQVSPPPHEQGELADICQEGNTGHFRQKSRVNGVAVNTYWSQSEQICFPTSQPTVTITQPANGAVIPWGPPLTLRAVAADPFDGPIFENAVGWTIGVSAVTPTSSHQIPSLSPGPHTADATVFNSQGAPQLAPAHVSFTVAAPTRFTVSIVAPADWAQIGDAYRNPVTFSATARDASGVRSDAAFSWRDDVDGALGNGATIQHTLSGGPDFQRIHHVTLTATAGGASDSQTITVVSGTP